VRDRAVDRGLDVTLRALLERPASRERQRIELRRESLASRLLGEQDAAVPDPAACRALLGNLRTLVDEDPIDLVALRERIVEAALETGGYPLGGTT